VILAGLASSPARATVQLPPIFSDGMVLQRDTAAPVWGWATPGEKITVTLNGQTLFATADAGGKWSAAFQKLAPGGPFTLTVTGDRSSPVTLSNVLVGDVWLCSGQSNMTLPIAAVKDFDPDVVTTANFPLLHCFTAPSVEAAAPLDSPAVKNAQSDTAAPGLAQGGDVSASPELGGKWQVTTPATVQGYTAMGFYFTRELHQKLGIPIGLVHSSYGGSSAEAWTSRDGLAAEGLGDQVDAQVKNWQNIDATGETYLTVDLAEWEAKYGRQDPGNKGLASGWANLDFDSASWTSQDALGNWTSLGLPDGGVVWARKEVDLPPGATGHNLVLNLGNLHNQNAAYGTVLGTVYFNGKEIGPFGHKLQHLFSGSDGISVSVPGSLVAAGKNVIALRIVDQLQTGPVFGTERNFLQPGINPQGWAKPWLVKVEETFPPLPEGALASRPPPPPSIATVTVSTLLYNGMIAPLVGYGIKGFLWDQGTANAFGGAGSLFEKDRPGHYQELLTGLIKDWRAKWKDDNLPFVFTQHPNFGGPPTLPSVSALAMLREAQLLTWETTPHSYMAVTLGLVPDTNIHYKNKKEAGRRLAAAALAGVYGEKIEGSGPIYESMTVEGNKVRIKFTHIGAGLVAEDGGPVKMFIIAGADKKFVLADAAIDGDTVVVSSNQVPVPVAVRYAWFDNPTGFNLFNKDGLPASPFRTDHWYWHEK
jgi:sialate O-acetylesterase